MENDNRQAILNTLNMIKELKVPDSDQKKKQMGLKGIDLCLQEYDTLVGKILNNKQNMFTKQQLEDKSLDELKMIAKLARIIRGTYEKHEISIPPSFTKLVLEKNKKRKVRKR